MKSLVVILATTVVVRGFRDGRAITSYGSDFLAYQRHRQQTPFQEQHQQYRQYPSTIYQQTFGQQPFRTEQPFQQRAHFKEYPSFKDYSSYKNPTSHPRQYSYRHLPSFSGDASTLKQEYPFKDQQFYAGNLPYKSESTYRKRFSFSDPLFADELSKEQTLFKDRPSDYKGRFSFRDPLYTDELSSIKEQPFFKDPAPAPKDFPSYQQLSTFDEKPQNYVNSMRTNDYREQTPVQPTNSYQEFQEQTQPYKNESQDFSSSFQTQQGQMPEKLNDSQQNQEQQQRLPLSFGGHSNYLKYGNHGLGFASVPAASLYGNALPLETETSTSATTALAGSNLKASVSSTAATNSAELLPTVTPVPKIATTSTTEQPSLRSNTINLAELRSTASTIMSTTLPPVSQQNSVELKKMSGIPTMTTQGPLSSFDQKMRYHISQTSTTAAPSSFYMPDTPKDHDQSRVNYLMPEKPKHHTQNSVGGTPMSYLMQEEPKYNVKSNMPNTMVNYIMPEEPKNNLKNNIQGPVTNYMMLQDMKNNMKDTIQEPKYSFKNNMQNAMVNYIMSEDPKNNLKSGVQGPIINYVMPQDMKNNMKDNIQGTMIRYMMPEDLKNLNFKSNIQGTFVNYLMPEDVKNNLKYGIQGSVANYLIPEEAKHNLKENIQGPLFKYLLSEESKHNFKSNIQGPVLNYLLPEEQKRTAAISFSESMRPEALNYVQLAIAERPKFSLPTNIPIATTLSAVSRPAETINYLQPSLPRVTFITPDTTSSANLPIGTGSATFIPRSATLPTGLSLGIADKLQANGIQGIITPSVSGSMSGSIPGTISANIPANIPTLNFGQSFQQDSGQMQPFGGARSSPFSAGLQLQLGGFGGVEYMQSASNSFPGPMGVGIAKVGLGLPDFPRPAIPTFTKKQPTTKPIPRGVQLPVISSGVLIIKDLQITTLKPLERGALGASSEKTLKTPTLVSPNFYVSSGSHQVEDERAESTPGFWL